MADINVPQSIWRQTNGNGEATFPGTDFLVDTTGTFLVDTTGTFIVDTGTDFQPIPQTIWIQNDGA